MSCSVSISVYGDEWGIILCHFFFSIINLMIKCMDDKKP